MSESGAEVRLVRCPKCENLLPELTNYSVYQCGGCGAVLRAKDNRLEADSSASEKSDEERVGGISDKYSDKSSEKSEGFALSERQKRYLSGEPENRMRSYGSSVSRTEKEVLPDMADRFRNDSMNGSKWVVENDMNLNMSKETDDAGNTEMANEFGDFKPQTGSRNGSQRSGHALDWRNGERGKMGRFPNNHRVDDEGVRYSTSNYLEEGPSNYQSGSSYAEPGTNRNGSDGFNKVEYLEQDRAELLRKLEELKDQINRSCNVTDIPKERVLPDRRGVHQDPYGNSLDWFPHGSLELNRSSMQYPVPNNHVAKPSYMGTYVEPSPFRPSFYPSLPTSNQVEGYGDPFRSEMIRRASSQAPGPIPQQSYPYFPRQHMDSDLTNMDLLQPYPPNINRHPHNIGNPIAYHNDYHGAFGPQNHNPRFGNIPPQLNSHFPQPQTRWPGDLNSELGGFVRQRPRVVLASGRRCCQPIHGGAPFIICCNCFELLHLPKKILCMGKGPNKMRCAACSKVVLLSVANKKLVLSLHVEEKVTPAKVVDNSNGANWASTDFSSDDYDNSGYDFQSMDRKPASVGPGLSSHKSTGTRSIHSTFSCTSEDEDIPTKANPSELPTKVNPSPPDPGSPLQDHIDYSNKYNAVSRFGKGNRSGRSEKVVGNVTSRQNSFNDAGVATEMEILSNEYSNTGISLDSGDASKEEDQLRVNKKAESFFAGIIKKSFREFSRSNQSFDQGSTDVTINGHPIPDRFVRKAEKLAGPIQSGEYWYDFRAGFWGLVGGPCLGIIPPFIEEFNYPMPENCSGGSTAVFVNGRELHPKDLNLLGSRGLPTERDRSYIIEISGRVLDEDSGEELECLGKLAPTIEKVKRGFGMKVPRKAV